jgi:hypothetical protein
MLANYSRLPYVFLRFGAFVHCMSAMPAVVNVAYWATPLLLPVVLLVEHTGSSAAQTMSDHTVPTLSASLFRLVVLAAVG